MNPVIETPIGIEYKEDVDFFVKMIRPENKLIYIHTDDMNPATPETVQYRMVLTLVPRQINHYQHLTYINQVAHALYRFLDDIKQNSRHMSWMWDKPLRGRAVTKYHETLYQAGRQVMEALQHLFNGCREDTPRSIWFTITLAMVPGEKGRRKFSYHTRAWVAYWDGETIQKDYLK